jgi:hypothetical protein
LVLAFVEGLALAAVLLLPLELAQLMLGDPEGFVDCSLQVRRLELLLEVLRLMRHHEIVAARDPHFDAHDRRDLAGAVVGALVDAYAA